MTLHKISELDFAKLDAAAAKAEGWSQVRIVIDPDGRDHCQVLMDADHGRGVWVTHNPSGLWSVGGPIIRRERIELDPNPDWDATGTMWAANVHWGGETALVAAMRCYVASKFGEYIDMM